MDPDHWFPQELDRITKYFSAQRWKGDQREIESAFGEIEIRLKEEQKLKLQEFVKGYDQKGIDETTNEILRSLRENMEQISFDQKYGSQIAMNQVKDAARRELENNPIHKSQRESAVAALIDIQAEELKLAFDREGAVLEANGFSFEPMLEKSVVPVPSPHLTELDEIAELKKQIELQLELERIALQKRQEAEEQLREFARKQ